MAAAATFDAGEPGAIRRWLPLVLGALLLLVAAWWLYTQFTSAHGEKVEAPSPTMVNMLPPPPPPPPPPPKPEEKPPEPTDKPNPVPNPEPAPAKAAPAPMTIAGPPQAGSDSFGLSAGSGQGSGAPSSTGTCLGANCGTGPASGGISDGFYRRYLSGALQEKVQGNGKVNRLVFTADFSITISGGRVTRVELLRSSGKDDRDALLKAILESVSGLDAPPASVRFPQKITVRGRRAI